MRLLSSFAASIRIEDSAGSQGSGITAERQAISGIVGVAAHWEALTKAFSMASGLNRGVFFLFAGLDPDFTNSGLDLSSRMS